MNFLNLQYFLVAAEELNFTRAAQRLYISQQALTSHIRKLEEYFGAELFDRVPPITLTNEGLCLVKRAKELMTIKDETLKEISDIKDFTKADLTIGIPISRGRLILPQIIEIYNRSFPNVCLHIFEGTSNEVEKALHEGSIDLNIGFAPEDMTKLEKVKLCMDKLVIIIPDKLLEKIYGDESLWIKRNLEKEVDIRLLKECPFLLMVKSTKTGMICRNMFNNAGVEPNIILESRNIETLLALCFKGVGITFCPEIYYKESFKSFKPDILNGIHAYPMKCNDAEKEIAASYLKDKFMTCAAKEFIRIACQCLGSE
ncbi:MAG: LysR family transcriptional regulator [Lachnospiraceae bacterium]